MAKKGAAVAMNLADSRYTDIKDEPVTRLLAPISGYEKTDLVSLEEAVAPIAHLFESIESNAWVAKKNCATPADGLTPDMSASIHLYTMQFGTDPSLFQELNKTLRTENRQALKPWFPFLKLFLSALHTLPSRAQNVYRGVRGVDLSSKYLPGTQFAWWSVSSCTESMEVLENDQFLGKKGLRTLFLIECQNGKLVKSHSYFKENEKEIILMPGSYFEVMSRLNPAEDLHIIQLKEIDPPFPLIKLPFTKQPSSASVKPTPAYVAPKITEYKEFADPGTFKELPCRGRACAKCHQCRDWQFKGDRATWDWLANWKNWKDEDKKRYRDGRYCERFTKRNGATCRLGDGLLGLLGGLRLSHSGYSLLLGYGLDCFCDDHYSGN